MLKDTYEYEGKILKRRPFNMAFYRDAKKFLGRFEDYAKDETWEVLGLLQEHQDKIEKIRGMSEDEVSKDAQLMDIMKLLSEANNKLTTAKSLFVCEMHEIIDAETQESRLVSNLEELFRVIFEDTNGINLNPQTSQDTMNLIDFTENLLTDFFLSCKELKIILQTSIMTLHCSLLTNMPK